MNVGRKVSYGSKHAPNGDDSLSKCKRECVKNFGSTGSDCVAVVYTDTCNLHYGDTYKPKDSNQGDTYYQIEYEERFSEYT